MLAVTPGRGEAFAVVKRVLLLLVVAWSADGFAFAELPPVAELLRLVRTNFPSLTAEQLGATTSEDLLARLGARARLLEDYEEPAANAPTAVTAEVFEGRFAYLRLGEVSGEAATAGLARLAALRATNRLAGCVLDLRFAGGRDFAAAVGLASQFLPANTPLLDWGEGIYLAPAVTNRIEVPLAVLVNGQTRGSAEALAAVLRLGGTGLLVGDTTAGDAQVNRDFALSTGQRLRLTVAAVCTANGERIPDSGVTPDLKLEVSPEVERAYLRDPFTAIRSTTNSPTATNSITTVVRVRRRVTEADLVREHDGQQIAPPPPAQESVTPPVRDPVLARGLDFLKGQALAKAQR